MSAVICSHVSLILLLLLLVQLASWNNYRGATAVAVASTEESLMHEQYLDAGNQYYASRQYEEALVEYKNALLLAPEYLPVLMNLGNLYRELGLYSESINELEKAYNINPEYYKASYNLGTTYYHMNEYSKAIESYANALKLEPNHVNSHYNMAVIYQETGQLMQALHSYRTVLTIDPLHIESRLNYCNILLALDDENCEKCYEQVLSIDPNYVKGIINLASYYQQRSPNGQVNARALELYQRAYELDHTDIMAKTALQTLSQQQQQQQELDNRYITELFDSYSYIFETSLVANLNYKSHIHVVEAIEKYMVKRDDTIHMADLGAGTGLICPFLKEKMTNLSIVGVDLSSKMLQQAKGKNCYNELVVSDIDSYLTKQEATMFDIIAATDVFVYFGDLENTLLNMQIRLKSAGLIVFTVEEYTGSDALYILQTTGRFAHQKAYIEDVITRVKLRVIALDQVVLRMDRGEPINGLLAVCQL